MADLQPQRIEYITATKGRLGDPATGEPVVIVTVRPDPSSFAVVNLALPKDQAWRLAADIQGLLLPFAILVCLLATTIGCGARVDLESAKWDSSGGETAATRVDVDVLQAQHQEPQAPLGGPKDGGRPLKIAPEPAATPQAAEPLPKPVVGDAKPVVGSGNTIIIFNYWGGDVIHHNETHIHLHEPPVPNADERVTVRQEVQAKPTRPVDKRCELMALEHQRRVEMWRKFPFGN